MPRAIGRVFSAFALSQSYSHNFAGQRDSDIAVCKTRNLHAVSGKEVRASSTRSGFLQTVVLGFLRPVPVHKHGRPALSCHDELSGGLWPGGSQTHQGSTSCWRKANQLRCPCCCCRGCMQAAGVTIAGPIQLNRLQGVASRRAQVSLAVVQLPQAIIG